YAAQVDRMDQGIGRVIEELRLTGQLDNTAIFFLQDNGGCAEEMGRSQSRPDPGDLKPMTPDQLQPQIWPPMQTRDGRWVRTGPGVMPGPADTYIAYGKNWANVSNTPFREYKHWTHEGGISTPLIAYWPAGISDERSGELESQPGHLIDLMATCVDLAGASYPKTVSGKEIQPMEGVSLRPAFEGKPLARKDPLFWEHEGNRAVREGNWKLVGKEKQPWELYDIATDRSELHDLANLQPERVSLLAAKWDSYAARAGVLPLGAWRKPASGAGEGLSKESRFELRENSKLDRKHAPAIAGRPLKVDATIDAGARGRGVIVAQGGSAFGYALFLDEASRPVFAKRDGGKLTVVQGPAAISGKHRVGGSIAQDGEMMLSVDGTAVGREKGRGPISMMPADGLQTGSDAGGSVGEYQTPNPFSGTIESVLVELGAAN
ncbi:MAG: sulfatase-like hydrolase/transferase, partial [Chthoniobacteraceae bacterium]